MIRGLFGFNLLKTLLSKRFRVNYGLHFKNKRLIRGKAVPYKSKDTPNDKSEFAHP